MRCLLERFGEYRRQGLVVVPLATEPVKTARIVTSWRGARKALSRKPLSESSFGHRPKPFFVLRALQFAKISKKEILWLSFMLKISAI